MTLQLVCTTRTHTCAQIERCRDVSGIRQMACYRAQETIISRTSLSAPVVSLLRFPFPKYCNACRKPTDINYLLFLTRLLVIDKGFAGVAVVFDSSDPDSFEQAKQWFSKLDALHLGKMPKVLIANKSDQPEGVLDWSSVEVCGLTSSLS